MPTQWRRWLRPMALALVVVAALVPTSDSGRSCQQCHARAVPRPKTPYRNYGCHEPFRRPYPTALTALATKALFLLTPGSGIVILRTGRLLAPSMPVSSSARPA
jgi:hypothetical protein